MDIYCTFLKRFYCIISSGKSEQVVPTTASKKNEFFLGTVHPDSNLHHGGSNGQQATIASKNTTEELLQKILNNIKLKSDSRLRPKLGSK